MLARVGFIRRPLYLIFLICCAIFIFFLFHIKALNFYQSNEILLNPDVIYNQRSSLKRIEWAQSQENNFENLVVIYNRIPKTGSTSFVNVAYDLCKKNGFNVLHLNTTKNSHTMSLSDQARFVYNVSHWTAKKPALYHGHVGFINFRKFGASPPLFINILRDPLERFISYYYFLRYGDNYRPYLIRSKHGNKMTFDDCIQQKKHDCDLKRMWLQIPFLCGHSVQCWKPGNEWALEEAKKNLLNEYVLVGTTNDLSSFVSMLEYTIPEMFHGASRHFTSSNNNHLRKTNKKIEPSEETIAVVKESVIWQMENELYEFAVQQFQFLKNQFRIEANGTVLDRGIQFRYEKIYPRN